MKNSVKKIIAGIITVAIVVSAPMYFGTRINVNAENSASSDAGQFKESGKIWIVGDSIASEHDIDEANEVQITGWGNVLQQIAPKDVTIINKARSGRSSKSYTTEPVYKEVIKGVGEGDYVIIQFGHNDEKEGAKLYTDPKGDSNTEGSYKYYLKTKFIEPIYEKGGRVILASSVVRHLFDGDKLGEQTHSVYAEAMKELAEECSEEGMEIYFIDTYKITSDIYTKFGDEKTKELHAVTGKGDLAQIDDTHYSPYGAVYIANVISRQLKSLGISCMQDAQEAWIIVDDSDALGSTRDSLDKFSWRK